jgi:hypothetical protein
VSMYILLLKNATEIWSVDAKQLSPTQTGGESFGCDGSYFPKTGNDLFCDFYPEMIK